VFVPENNTVDVVVAKINADRDVRLTVVKNPEDLFYLKGNEVVVKKGLDYEVIPHDWKCCFFVTAGHSAGQSAGRTEGGVMKTKLLKLHYNNSYNNPSQGSGMN